MRAFAWMSCWVLVAWVLWLNAVTFAAPVAQDISCLEGLNSTWPKFQMDAIDACDTAGVRCGVTPESGGSRRVLAIERPGSGFYGPIPQSLRNCTALRVLNLAKNDLQGADLADMITSWPYLETLDLSFNKNLGGPLPTPPGAKQQWMYVKDFILNDCSFSGSIPPTFFQSMGEGLETVYLHNNQLTGPFPAAKGNVSVSFIKNLRLDNNQLECPDDTNATSAVQPSRECDVSSNSLCERKHAIYTPKCPGMFSEACRITPCQDTKEPQPIDPAGVWIPITELLRTFVKPSSPAAILRIGTENDYVDMIARAVAVYETYSDVNGFALIQGITPVSQYTLLDGLSWTGYRTSFTGTSGQEVPHFFLNSTLPNGAQITFRTFVLGEPESLYMYSQNLTSLGKTLKFGMDIQNWVPTVYRNVSNGIYFTSCTIVFEFFSEQVIEIKAQPDDFPREFNASASFSFAAELPARNASVMFRFPPLASINRRNTFAVGLGLVPNASFDTFLAPAQSFSFATHMLNTENFVSFDPDLTVLFTPANGDAGDNTVAIAVGVSVSIIVLLIIAAIVAVFTVPKLRNKVLPFKDRSVASMHGPSNGGATDGDTHNGRTASKSHQWESSTKPSTVHNA